VSHSIYSADRMTHLKIVVAALIAGIAAACVGISVRLVLAMETRGRHA
jgi:hypothetical protein